MKQNTPAYDTAMFILVVLVVCYILNSYIAAPLREIAGAIREIGTSKNIPGGRVEGF